MCTPRPTVGALWGSVILGINAKSFGCAPVTGAPSSSVENMFSLMFARGDVRSLEADPAGSPPMPRRRRHSQSRSRKHERQLRGPERASLGDLRATRPTTRFGPAVRDLLVDLLQNTQGKCSRRKQHKRRTSPQESNPPLCCIASKDLELHTLQTCNIRSRRVPAVHTGYC